MIVVPSFAPTTQGEAEAFLRAHRGSKGPVELRIDRMRTIRLDALLARPRPKVIVTCRRAVEGGRFTGSARDCERILAEAASLGAEFIDVEYGLGSKVITRLFGAAGRRRIILSFHDPKRTPAGLSDRYRRMTSMKPAFVKIAVGARRFADTGRVLEILAVARRKRQPAAIISIGEFGVYTRILQGPLGGAMTYAAHDDRKPTAPGQVGEKEMLEIYRAPALNSRTKIFGLLGNPVAFSRGSIYHNGVFLRKKKNAVYVNFASDDVGEFMRIIGGRVAGFSVTMPFKRSIAGFLDTIEGSSLLTGSVNTVVRRRGRLIGLNTDFHAFLSLLGRHMRPAGNRMLVLGTGGTAATVAGAGIFSGMKVTVAGRDPRKARTLAERFGCDHIPIEQHRSIRADVLVNTTPVGMDPRVRSAGSARMVPTPTLRNYRIVIDFANPPAGPTPLVEAAIRHRRTVITGADIFAAQARLQSKLFLDLL